jgi:protein SCO1
MTLTNPNHPTATTADATRRRRHRGRTVALAVGIPLVVLTLGYVGLRLLTPHPYAGTVMQAPTEAPSLAELTGTDGGPVDVTDYRGDLVLLFFGYTSCPDVCPTTLSMVHRSLEQLGNDADRVHVMMVSVDPERDDLDRLRDYVHAFDPTFLGATGDLPAVERAASSYGVFFARGDALGDGYTVDHTATLMAIDTDGHLRVVWPADVLADDLTSDLRELL